MAQRIRAGATTRGEGWKPYNGGHGIYIDVDTSDARFPTTPFYFTSIGGKSEQWALVGPSAVYFPKPDGFRVYVRWSDGSALTPARAKDNEWYINWIGFVHVDE
ncbi:hypothetical protein HTZ77_25800 [Nonomuraea sp. SMC257]|uniref:Uncharacterized protein n=1 Tax=Nonomuraea montanisoli TaxID=2741721 RepID=A0A7Y6M4I1_9ACTN|nr:hypothetical protein [Nonomuraea montanisoli]NUW34818.1 hypothetical protein [Nonomuraea montanisoli]